MGPLRNNMTVATESEVPKEKISRVSNADLATGYMILRRLKTLESTFVDCKKLLNCMKRKVNEPFLTARNWSVPLCTLTPQSFLTLNSAALRKKTTRSGGKVSLSPREIQGHMQPSKYFRKFQRTEKLKLLFVLLDITTHSPSLLSSMREWDP